MNTATTYPPVPDALTGRDHECNYLCRGGLHCCLGYFAGRRSSDAAFIFDFFRGDFGSYFGVQLERIEHATEAPPGTKIASNLLEECQPGMFDNADPYLLFYRHLDGDA